MRRSTRSANEKMLADKHAQGAKKASRRSVGGDD
jgi:hypothetical protein